MPTQTIRTLALACAVVGITAGQAVAQPAGEVPLALSAEDRGLTWSPCPPMFPAGCEITVLHGDPTQRNADIFFKVPGGYEIPRHWHTSAERMVLVWTSIPEEVHWPFEHATGGRLGMAGAACLLPGDVGAAV